MNRIRIFNAFGQIGATAVCAIMLAAGSAGSARAQDYQALMASPDRADADRQADAKRNPVKVLDFAAPKTGWKILDMGAGAGYSTELMARAVGPSGKVYGQNGKDNEKLDARLKSPAMANATQLTRPYDDPVPADVHDLDLITFFNFYHDTTYMEVDRAKMDKAMLAALKPGGYLVVIDYVAKPEDGAKVGKTLHRIAEHSVREEIEAAGFKFVTGSDAFRHPEDPHTEPSFKTNPVDEFALKFQKPM